MFLHGSSLYQTERSCSLLVILPPVRGPLGTDRREPVSLRELPATIVDLRRYAGTVHRFQGMSLARSGNGSTRAGAGRFRLALIGCSAEVVPLDPLDPDPHTIGERRWPLGALADGDWTYIRREGRRPRRAVPLRDDPQELHNLAGDKATQPILERMRQALAPSDGRPADARAVQSLILQPPSPWRSRLVPRRGIISAVLPSGYRPIRLGMDGVTRSQSVAIHTRFPDALRLFWPRNYDAGCVDHRRDRWGRHDVWSQPPDVRPWPGPPGLAWPAAAMRGKVERSGRRPAIVRRRRRP